MLKTSYASSVAGGGAASGAPFWDCLELSQTTSANNNSQVPHTLPFEHLSPITGLFRTESFVDFSEHFSAGGLVCKFIYYL